MEQATGRREDCDKRALGLAAMTRDREHPRDVGDPRRKTCARPRPYFCVTLPRGNHQNHQHVRSDAAGLWLLGSAASARTPPTVDQFHRSPDPHLDLVTEFLAGIRINKDEHHERASQIHIGSTFRF